MVIPTNVHVGHELEVYIMPVWFITGRLGSGKSLVGVMKAKEYLQQHRRVATNMDLYLEHLVPEDDRTASVTRLPDKPSADDINSLGNGHDGEYDESKFGFLLLDELGSWLNSRSWNSKERQPFIETCIHLRKRQWDVGFLVQNIKMVDAQVRDALCEYLVTCKRTDRLKVPMTDINLPKYHVGTVYYGDTPNKELKEDTWVFKGKEMYKAYDTTQAFSPFYPHGVHSLLPPTYFIKPSEKEKQGYSMRAKTIFASVVLAGVGFGIYTAVKSFSGGASGFLQTNETDALVETVISEAPAVQQKEEKESVQKKITHLLSGYKYTGYLKTVNGLILQFEDRSGNGFEYDEQLFNDLGYQVVKATYAMLVATSNGSSIIFTSNGELF